MVLALIVPFVVSMSHSASAATYTGCSNWRTVNNPWTGLPITPGSNQRYANLNSLDLSCVDLNGVDFYGAVLGGVNWTRSNLSNTNFGGTGYCGGIFTGADIAGSNVKSTGMWSCASATGVYVNPVTTTVASTTLPTTTTPATTTTTAATTVPASTTTTITSTTLPAPTTTIPMSFCIWTGAGSRIEDRIYFYGSSTAPNNPVFTAYSSVTWLSMTHALRIGAGAVFIPVNRGTSCSQFDSNPPLTTTTSSSVPTTTTLPAPISFWTTTTTIPTTTCAPTTDTLFIYSFFQTGLVTNHVPKFDPGSSGWGYDFLRRCAVAPITAMRIEDKSGVRTQTSLYFSLDFNTKVSNCWRISRVSRFGQSDWSNQVCYTAPSKKGSTGNSRLNKTVPKGVTGAQCLDGYRTKARTKSACSKNFGVDYWLFKPARTGYVSSYIPRKSFTTAGYGTGKCVGMCFGVPSTVNGLPRNTPVKGYFRKDGTYVSPYTRSSR
jgi:hypothetical protein